MGLIGKLGQIGIAFETVAGTAESAPTVMFPFIESPKVNDRTDVLMNMASNGNRANSVDGIKGKQWAEGDLSLNLDVVNSGYIFKWFFSNELYTASTPKEHRFYPTVSGNTPKTATVFQKRDTGDLRKFAYGCLDSFEINVGEELATLKASIKADLGVDDSAQAVATISGTVFSFANYTLKLGADIATAEASSALDLGAFNLLCENNLEVIHRSGANGVNSIIAKILKVSGSFNLFFDSLAQLNAYKSVSRRAMVVTFTGNNNEELKIRIGKMVLTDHQPDSSLDTLYVSTCNFEAILETGDNPNYIDITLKNDKVGAYA